MDVAWKWDLLTNALINPEPLGDYMPVDVAVERVVRWMKRKADHTIPAETVDPHDPDWREHLARRIMGVSDG